MLLDVSLSSFFKFSSVSWDAGSDPRRRSSKRSFSESAAGLGADGRSLRDRFCECSSSDSCFRFWARVDGRAISSWEGVGDFWRAAAAVSEERNCRGWVSFRGEGGLLCFGVGFKCFKQRSLRCQHGRLQNGRGERYLLRGHARFRVYVWEAYRVGDSEGILAPRSMLNIRRHTANISDDVASGMAFDE